MPLIGGRAKGLLDESIDLFTLANPVEEDYLSRLLQDHWIFRKRNTTDPLDRRTTFKNLHQVETVTAFDMILAAMLLIGVIVDQYLLEDPRVKLGFIAMFTLLFTQSIVLCTNARRAEFFAAALIVFVSGDLGGNKIAHFLIQLEGGVWKTLRCPG